MPPRNAFLGAISCVMTRVHSINFAHSPPCSRFRNVDYTRRPALEHNDVAFIQPINQPSWLTLLSNSNSIQSTNHFSFEKKAVCRTLEVDRNEYAFISFQSECEWRAASCIKLRTEQNAQRKKHKMDPHDHRLLKSGMVCTRMRSTWISSDWRQTRVKSGPSPYPKLGLSQLVDWVASTDTRT